MTPENQKSQISNPMSLELITWVDSSSMDGGPWLNMADVLIADIYSTVANCVSVGVVVYESDDEIRLVSSFTDESMLAQGLTEKTNFSQCSGNMNIPKVAIVKRQILQPIWYASSEEVTVDQLFDNAMDAVEEAEDAISFLQKVIEVENEK